MGPQVNQGLSRESGKRKAQGALLPRGDRNRWRIRRPTVVMTDVANLRVSDSLAVRRPPRLHLQKSCDGLRVSASVQRALSRTYMPSSLMPALQWAPGPPAVNYDPIKSVEWALGSVQEVPGDVKKVLYHHCALVSERMLPVYTCQRGNVQPPPHHGANLHTKH